MTSVGDNYITIGRSIPIEGEGVDHFFGEGWNWDEQYGKYYFSNGKVQVDVGREEGSLMPVSEEEARAWQES